jgi:SHS family lactate transporter-like MFS transporter
VAAAHKVQENLFASIRRNAGLFVWAVVLMTCFNFFSHGTQDMYPTFLLKQRGLTAHQVSMVAVTYNIGAILGGLCFGALSNKIGRRRAIVLAALLALPVIPLWALSATPVLLALGAFMMQFFVQGAWGIVPAHLNELSPPEVRGTFPGFTYQVGNLLASYNATLQAGIAQTRGGDYAFALMLVAGSVALLLALVAGFGREERGRAF